MQITMSLMNLSQENRTREIETSDHYNSSKYYHIYHFPRSRISNYLLRVNNVFLNSSTSFWAFVTSDLWALNLSLNCCRSSAISFTVFRSFSSSCIEIFTILTFHQKILIWSFYYTERVSYSSNLLKYIQMCYSTKSERSRKTACLIYRNIQMFCIHRHSELRICDCTRLNNAAIKQGRDPRMPEICRLFLFP